MAMGIGMTVLILAAIVGLVWVLFLATQGLVCARRHLSPPHDLGRPVTLNSHTPLAPVPSQSAARARANSREARCLRPCSCGSR